MKLWPFKRPTRFLVFLVKTILYLLIFYCFFSISFVFVPSVYNDLYISKKLKNKFFSFNNSKDNYKTIAIISPTRLGEFQQAVMVREVAEAKGDLVYSYAINDTEMRIFKPAALASEFLIFVLDLLFKPDLHLVMSYHVNVNIPEPKVMYISVPLSFLKQEVERFYPKFWSYNKFILISSYDDFDSYLPKNSQVIEAVVGAPKNDFREVKEHNKILYFGTAWGRNSELLKKLADKDYFYFLQHPALVFGSNKQKFADPALDYQKFQDRLNEYGVVLCLHSEYHLHAAIPSSRIFEIISSGAIVISDYNPFIFNNFGDNVLYINQNSNDELVINKIEEHLIWLQKNPEATKLKAKNAHDLMQNNFSTEIFFDKVIKSFCNKNQ